jgi:hypothetical protein
LVLRALVLLVDDRSRVTAAWIWGGFKRRIRRSVISVFVGLTVSLVVVLTSRGTMMAEELGFEDRAAYVSQQVVALLGLSSRSRESMESVYRAVYAALYRAPTQPGEEKHSAGQGATSRGGKGAQTAEMREPAAEAVVFRITRKVWALSRNIQFYHHESLALASAEVSDAPAFERYKHVCEILQGQFESLQGDIEKLRELCSDRGPKAVPLRKMKELAEKISQLEDQIKQTRQEIQELRIGD